MSADWLWIVLFLNHHTFQWLKVIHLNLLLQTNGTNEHVSTVARADKLDKKSVTCTNDYAHHRLIWNTKSCHSTTHTLRTALATICSARPRTNVDRLLLLVWTRCATRSCLITVRVNKSAPCGVAVLYTKTLHPSLLPSPQSPPTFDRWRSKVATSILAFGRGRITPV